MPNRNVLTMAVGTYEHVLIRIRTSELQPGDQFLLCSDGLHGPVDHATISQSWIETGELRRKVDATDPCGQLEWRAR